jgi:hypothetical protein
MSASRSIPALKKTINKTINIEGTEFECTMYPNPHNKSASEINQIVEIFGNRLQNGKSCLGITEDSVRKDINNKVYTALIFVKNNLHNDSATCSLQYYNWCDENSSEKSIWINDLCRVKETGKKLISPVRALLQTVEDFSKSKGITENYLLVEKDKNGTSKLLEVYGGYKFIKNDDCAVNGYIAMKKSFS